MTLIAVVLNGHQTHYSDTKALFLTLVLIVSGVKKR